ncbi:MAG: hypothetical protein RRY29_10720 [Desulfovibrionaceae bacterium]
MHKFHLEQAPLALCLTIQPMGTDICAHLFGGTRSPNQEQLCGGHVGAVALALPRPSKRGTGENSASVSLLTVPGHQEDLLTRQLALLLARHTGTTVVLVCGIHVDAATPDIIHNLENMAYTLVQNALTYFEMHPQKDVPCCN